MTHAVARDIVERLETHEGQAIYLHAADCPSFCEYACNGPQNDKTLDALYAFLPFVVDALATPEATASAAGGARWRKEPLCSDGSHGFSESFNGAVCACGGATMRITIEPLAPPPPGVDPEKA